ncbi:6-hydroxymethylpterin diphosphokinase MptE-like protein [Aestuariispira insulae]|uniref:DUF115 domain-containing protein n=1 Tax=Aestuariispira insulae TaxID=1461337 RepID=A0A3D9HNE8_9PROT|nr:6-hydroxymethylpterin diphosphokinase MptE-like protein [Aestuariispira insulae]RED51020.1 hypothetical protein DFP90_104297 [Aestuariispira insulae]
MTQDTRTPISEGMTLFSSNLRALSPHIRPGLMERLEKEPPLNVKAVRLSNGRHNMTVEGNAVYVPDAETFAEEQLQAYGESPMRLSYSLAGLKSLDTSGPDDDNDEFSLSIIKHLQKKIQAPLSDEPAPDAIAGYGLSLGLGLGLHLQGLVTSHNFRDLIIFDPCLDTLRCSMHVIDWVPIVETLEARGGRIKFLFEMDPDLAAKAIMAFMREENFGLIDGSYIFRHYPLPVIQQTMRHLSNLKSDLIIYNGWLEDEMIHFKNGMRNFLYRDLRLLDHPLSTEKNCPAFIIGSGPSLSQDIETIKNLREKAVIFSCGSSIRILLSHGIKPDFHCELENVFSTVPVIAEVAGKFDLSGITLIASTTVHPAVFNFFEDHVVFFREGGGAVRWMQQDRSQLSHASPSCTNAGARVAIQMGFANLYLFGIDLGSTNPAKHHAEGSIYTSLADASERDRVKDMKLAIENYPLTCEGNFRELVHTSPLMTFMKNSLELLALTMPEVTIINCSDGAAIAGTKPLRSAKIILSEEADHLESKDRLLKSLEQIGKGSFISVDYLQKLEDSLVEWNRRFHAICLSDDCRDFLEFHDSIRELCDLTLPTGDIDQFDRATRILMSGTLLKILHFVRFHDLRMSDEHRKRFYEDVRETLFASLPELEARQIEIIRHFRNRLFRRSANESQDLDLMDQHFLSELCDEAGFTNDTKLLDKITRTALEQAQLPPKLIHSIQSAFYYQGRSEDLERICSSEDAESSDMAKQLIARPFKPAL